jgi:mRNA interferase MazF
MGVVKRFEIYLVSLDPTKGNEIKKTRPCLIISPNEMHSLSTIIIAPMTTTNKPFPTRVAVNFAQKKGFIVLDQIRTIDKVRLVKNLGSIDKNTGLQVLKILQEMFQY